MKINIIMLEIKTAMEQQGMKQTDLAKKVGLTETTISRYFNGTREPKLDDLENMLDAVGLRIKLIKGDSMSKSILCTEKECFICHKTEGLHKHHCIYGTANRKLSEADGLWVWLCAEHHNMSNEGVHSNHPFDVMLKKYAQKVWELHTLEGREAFRRRYGQSYL